MPSKIVNVHEAKTHLSRLLEEVRGGAEIIVAKAGTPVARLVPYHSPGKIKLGFWDIDTTDAFFEPLPEEELAAWEGSEPDPLDRT